MFWPIQHWQKQLYWQWQWQWRQRQRQQRHDSKKWFCDFVKMMSAPDKLRYSSYVIEDSGMTAKEWHWTEFAIIAMFRYPSGPGAVSSPKCSLPGLLSKELLIFDNKCFPTCAFISFVWCKFQINPRSLRHSPLPLRFDKKYCFQSFRRKSSSIWQDSFICSIFRTWLVTDEHLKIVKKSLLCINSRTSDPKKFEAQS